MSCPALTPTDRPCDQRPPAIRLYVNSQAGTGVGHFRRSSISWSIAPRFRRRGPRRGSSKRPGPAVDVLLRTTRRHQHQLPTAAHGAGPLSPEKWPARGADVGFALDGGRRPPDSRGRFPAAVVDGRRCARRPGARPAGPQSAAERRLVVSIPVERAASRRRRGAAARSSGTRRGQVHPRRNCSSNGAGLEARRAATSSSSCTPQWGWYLGPSRSCPFIDQEPAAALAIWRLKCRMLPSSNGAIPARHKDQWEGDPAIRKAIAAQPKLASGRAVEFLVRRRERSRRSGSWSRGQMAFGDRVGRPGWLPLPGSG